MFTSVFMVGIEIKYRYSDGEATNFYFRSQKALEKAENIQANYRFIKKKKITKEKTSIQINEVIHVIAQFFFFKTCRT